MNASPDTTIAVYDAIGKRIYLDTYPAEWPLKELQRIARKWMRYTNGARYVIQNDKTVLYRSKPRVAAAAERSA